VTASVAPTAPGDLMALLSGDVNIDLDWSDPLSPTEANEAGYRVLRSVDGGDFALRASLPRDSVSYSDNNLANASYAYKLEVYNGAGAGQTAATTAIEVSAPLVAVASSETSVTGSVLSGSYLDTQGAAGSERVSEQHSGGKPSRRTSSLDHRWTIPGVVPSATVKLYLRASAPLNGDGDDFDFTYSVDGGPALPVGTLPHGASNQIWNIALPANTSGAVVVRVVDTDSTSGNGGTDTVTIHEMHVTSAGSLADLPPEVTITEPANGTTIPAGTETVFSATVTDEDAGLAAALSWSSDRDGDLGTSASLAATLSEGAHVVTASVLDSALQPGSDSVSVTVTVSAPAPDTTPPAVTVLGDNPASVTVGAVYADAGATATDLVDGDLSAFIATTGLPVDTTTTGTRFVVYTVSDAAGNSGEATRTVNVVEAGGGLTVTGISPINRADLPGGASVTISGTGFGGDPTVTFQNGPGPVPIASEVTVGGAGTLTATVSSKSGPRKTRVWDVVVTLQSGVSAVCTGCLTISP
jgi:hypothetical protein